MALDTHGKVTSWNATAERMFGVTSEDARARSHGADHPHPSPAYHGGGTDAAVGAESEKLGHLGPFGACRNRPVFFAASPPLASF
jgi:PAS domain-containing protein